MDHATTARLRPCGQLILLTCDICSRSPRVPLIDACGHLFCFSCLNRMNRVLPGECPVRLDSCPFCRNINLPVVGTFAARPTHVAASHTVATPPSLLNAQSNVVDSLLGNSMDSQLEYINNELNRINDELDRVGSLLAAARAAATPRWEVEKVSSTAPSLIPMVPSATLSLIPMRIPSSSYLVRIPQGSSTTPT